MFKKIQNYLLINHPMLWNMKIVPIISFLLGFNCVFYIIGYLNGAVRFGENKSNFCLGIDDEIILFLSILISILSLIVWLVFYFKNNSLKSFYPKSNISLFKEWALLVAVSFLISIFSVSYFFGKDCRVRNYYSKIEAKKRCETLALASIFIEGSFRKNFFETIESGDSTISVPVKFLDFKGKKYDINSLYNKDIEHFSFFDAEKDSINCNRVYSWLEKNQKDSVQNLFKNYLKIAKEHNLKSSLTAEKWLEMVYDHPNFNTYKNISKKDKEYYSGTENINEYVNENRKEAVINPKKVKIDSTMQYVQSEGDVQYLHNRFYVPASDLNESYQNISKSWVSPSLNFETFLIPVYFALAIAILIFSFRVTSGRNWLIALVSIGVLNIIIGIISAILSTEIIYLVSILVLFLVLLFYFIYILYLKKGKKLSGITLNLMLWIIPGFIPLCYFTFSQVYKKITHYVDYQYDGNFNIMYSPLLNAMNEYAPIMLYINLLIVALMMLYFSFKIKKWKGISES
jgi:hypothetical protein